MKWAGMLVGNFELNPFRRPIWAWSTPLLTPNRDHVRKQTNIYFHIFSCTTLNETFTAKYNGVLPRAPSGDQNQKFTLLSETTSIPTPFICESLTPLPRLHPSLYNFAQNISTKYLNFKTTHTSYTWGNAFYMYRL